MQTSSTEFHTSVSFQVRKKKVFNNYSHCLKLKLNKINSNASDFELYEDYYHWLRFNFRK